MRGFFIHTPNKVEDIRSSNKIPPEDSLKELIASLLPSGCAFKINRTELYYIRLLIKGDKEDIVYYVPEFAYALDIDFPRVPIVSLGYELPIEILSPTEKRVVGLGDPHFPDFKEAKIFSAKSFDKNDILFPVVAKQLIIGVEPEASESDVVAALKPYVENVVRSGYNYTATVKAFHESDIAKKIEKEVEIVRYAELNNVVRDRESGVWYVDRVL